MKHPFLRTLLLTLAIGALLASCRSTVPQPSKVLDTNSQSKQYQWINNAPLRASDAQSVHFTDLNQDGFIDLLLGISNGTSGFQVKWGDGTGNWTSQSGPPTAMQPLSFATADINHDQNIDILIGGKGGLKGLQIWELHPDKKTWKLHSSPTTTGVFSTVKFADINNDGWSDIIATRLDSNENGGVFVLLNDGKNGWVSGTGPVAKGLFTGLSVEDINNDGNMDIVTSRRGGLGAIEGDDEVWKQVGGIQLWYGDGNGRWQPAELPASSDAESLVVADMNGDGNLDIISGLYQAGITIWWNNNNAWDKEQIMTTGTWSDIHVADLDADGKRELVASSSVGQGLQVWRWQGGNFKKDNNLVPSFGVYLDLDLGDIRNDGTLAIAATRAGAGLEIWSSTKPNPLPIQQSIAKKVGSLLSIYFDSGKALLTSDAEKSLETWLKTLNSNIIDLHLELQGHAGQRHIHSELYPNNLSLSQARAESVAAWLVNHGVSSKQITIKALGDGHPISTGATPDALKKNRRVLMQAYQVRTARLPLSTASLEQTDLYQVTENKVFKTIGGIPEYKVG
ncbi:MAG TPA: hypothetical protein EYG66_05795, partial [Mariprofundaceae bacterium]|nr:hypothetical protein [Mariprofundaceae bacterium]